MEKRQIRDSVEQALADSFVTVSQAENGEVFVHTSSASQVWKILEALAEHNLGLAAAGTSEASSIEKSFRVVEA